MPRPLELEPNQPVRRGRRLATASGPHVTCRVIVGCSPREFGKITHPPKGAWFRGEYARSSPLGILLPLHLVLYVQQLSSCALVAQHLHLRIRFEDSPSQELARLTSDAAWLSHKRWVLRFALRRDGPGTGGLGLTTD